MSIECPQTSQLLNAQSNSIDFRAVIDHDLVSCDKLRKIILFPKRGLTCDDPYNCKVTYQNKDYVLTPRRLPSLGSVQIYQYLPLDNQEVNEVVYYIDGNAAYRTNKIEEFKMGYVPIGEHELTTAALMSDGQTLRDTKATNIENFSVIGYLKPVAYRYMPAARTFGFYMVLLLILFAAIRSAFYIKKQILKNLNTRNVLPSTEINEIKHFETKDSISFIKNFIKWPLLLLGVFALINSYFVTYYNVSGKSMEPTYGDKSKRILFKAPVLITRLTKSVYMPKRGQIIVFEKNGSEYFDDNLETQKSRFVKRVIGLPGERIKIEKGILMVYNKQNPEGFNPDKNSTWESIIAPSIDHNIDVQISDDEVFVVGDNRVGSFDSRSYGPIKIKQITGTSH